MTTPQVTCSGIVITSQCSVIATPGRDCFNAPVAIMLHCVPFTASQYLAMQGTPFTQGESFFTTYPKSVNYFVSTAGFVWELVPPGDTAWGISEFQAPSWTTLSQYTNITSPNNPFIHIGFEGNIPNNAQISAMINLSCCMMLKFGIPLEFNSVPNIVFPAQLDNRLTCPAALPPNFSEIVGACMQQGGISPNSGNITQLTQDVNKLKTFQTTTEKTLAELCACCNDLRTRVSSLETKVTTIETSTTAATAAVTALTTQVATLTAQIDANTKKIAEHDVCFNELCKPKEVPCISYALYPQNAVTVTPGAERRLALPTKIFDTNPPTMNGTVLQNLCLSGGCTFRIRASVRFAAAEWCKDRKASLFFNTCTGKVLLQEFVIPADGNRVVELSGETQVVTPPTCNTNYLSVLIDDVTTPNKIIELATIEACCQNRTCPPSPPTIVPPTKTFPNQVT